MVPLQILLAATARHRAGRRRRRGGELPGRAEDRRGDAAHAAGGRCRAASCTPRRRWCSPARSAASGLWLLCHFVNALTMWLTLATFVGYAVVYTVILKPATPQNIVIGGASGAMPPVLGWAAVTGEVTIEAMLLFLIIFAWTPPHFWSLALYRTEDYARAGVPMLPVTHGKRVHPAAGAALHADPVRASACCPTSIAHERPRCTSSPRSRSARVFLAYALRIYLAYSDALARKTFRYSIVYLAFAVRGASGRSLPVACALAARLRQPSPKFKSTDITGAPYGQALELTDHTGKPRRAGGFPRQGGGALLRLHPLPGRLPDHAGRHRAGDEEARPRRRARAGAHGERRPGARHAGVAREVRDRLRPALPRPARRPRRDAQGGEGVQDLLREAQAGRHATRVDHSAQSYVIDPQGRLRLLVRHDRIAQDLAHDLRTLLREKRGQDPFSELRATAQKGS